jgi:hypothetical protein
MLHIDAFISHHRNLEFYSKIRSIDARIQSVADQRGLNLFKTLPSDDLDQFRIYFRNMLVYDLYKSDLKELTSSVEAKFLESIILVYPIMLISIFGLSLGFHNSHYQQMKICGGTILASLGYLVFRSIVFSREYSIIKDHLGDRYLEVFFRQKFISSASSTCGMCKMTIGDNDIFGHRKDISTFHVFHKKCLKTGKGHDLNEIFHAKCPSCEEVSTMGRLAKL